MNGIRWTRQVLIFAFLAAASAAGTQAGVGGLSRPIAIAPLGGPGQVVVLESDGRLVSVSTTKGEVHPLVGSFAPARPIDMATYSGDGGSWIFLTASRTSDKSARSPEMHAVLQIDPSGKVVARWNVLGAGALSGVATWPAGKAVFAATSQTGEIIKLQPGSRSQPTRWTALDGVYALGPLAVDPERHTLWTADPIQGALFAVDLETKRVRRIAAHLGQLLSLVVDEANDRLYMADASGRRIWSLDLKNPEAKPTVFSDDSRFRQPAGVAIVDGTVWVADRFAGKLFALSKEGKIVRELG